MRVDLLKGTVRDRTVFVHVWSFEPLAPFVCT